MSVGDPAVLKGRRRGLWVSGGRGLNGSLLVIADSNAVLQRDARPASVPATCPMPPRVEHVFEAVAALEVRTLNGCRPPESQMLAKPAATLPAGSPLPGGTVYEPRWDGCRAVIEQTSARRLSGVVPQRCRPHRQGSPRSLTPRASTCSLPQLSTAPAGSRNSRSGPRLHRFVCSFEPRRLDLARERGGESSRPLVESVADLRQNPQNRHHPPLGSVKPS